MPCEECETRKKGLANVTYQATCLEAENRELKAQLEKQKKEQSEIIRAIIVSLTQEKE